MTRMAFAPSIPLRAAAAACVLVATVEGGVTAKGVPPEAP
jgi:hypothetical protein